MEKPICWRTKDGDIPITQLTDEHLQKAIYYAEHRFMHHNNRAMAEADASALFLDLLEILRDECKSRGVAPKSLADAGGDKYRILINAYRVAAMEGEQ